MDRDFDQLVRRIPAGNRTRVKELGRITFTCNEVRGRSQLERWIDHIELHYNQATTRPDIRMIVLIQENAVKFF